MNQSPRGLWALELNSSPSALREAYDAFDRRRGVANMLPIGTCASCMGLPRHLELIGLRLEQAKGDASSLCGEAELGPIKHWYRILLYGNLETTREGLPKRPYFSNMDCLIKSGYALWDDIEFDWEPLPPIQVLNNQAIQRYSHMFGLVLHLQLFSSMERRFGNFSWVSFDRLRWAYHLPTTTMPVTW